MGCKLLYVFCILVLAVFSQGEESCSFPPGWSREPYFTHRMAEPEGVASLNKYIVTFWTTSSSEAPSEHSMTYHCNAFENKDGKVTYLSVISGRLERLSGWCIEQRHIIPPEQTSGGYLISKKAYNDNVDSSDTLNQCKAVLNEINLFSVYLAVNMNHHSEGFTMAFANPTQCPLPNSPFRVTYTVSQSDQNHCENEMSSVLSVFNGQISILACDSYGLYKDFPLTGILNCLADISPTEIGEQNEDNGRLVVLQWISRTQRHAHYYCSRIKVFPNSTILISMDITDTGSINCQKDARYDWYGQHGERSFFRMKLTFDPLLASSTTSKTGLASVTPAMNPTVSPSTSTTTTTAPTAVHNIQMTLVMSFPEDVNRKQKELQALVWNKCNILHSRTVVVLEKGRDGETVVTYMVEPGLPSAPECAQVLDSLETITISGQTVNIRGDVIHWSAESRCPDMTCKNDGVCWNTQGNYTCLCVDGVDGQYCQVSASTAENSSRLTIILSLCIVAGVLIIIAIIVVVVVTKRCREDKAAVDSVSEYDSMGSVEKQERDMYNSMSRATAYHEKAFIGDADEEKGDHGEKTGIHGFSNNGYI